MNIWLVGYMGSGKSTAARAWSEQMNANFIDVDQEIEKYIGMSISAIWQKHGEGWFRVFERQQCFQIGDSGRKIIATGGGVPIHSFAIHEMQESGKVIYLKADAETLWSRVVSGASESRRPLVTDFDAFATRLEKRAPIYELADAIIDARQPIDAILRQLNQCWKSMQ